MQESSCHCPEGYVSISCGWHNCDSTKLAVTQSQAALSKSSPLHITYPSTSWEINDVLGNCTFWAMYEGELKGQINIAC